MLHIGKDRVGRLYIGPVPVALLYRGAVKVYEAVASCFGSGRWRSQKPWKGRDRWRN